jgi:hypothetical protein
MSELLRVALIGEGATDKVVLQSALSSRLGDRSFIFRQLQPEESQPFGPIGTGWPGVYKWCREAVVRNHGSLRNDVLYKTYDILILQLDADVAENKYSQGGIREVLKDLPFSEPCPPPSATTNRLRNVLLRWVGETNVPPKTVLCTPSKNMEAWVIAALFPRDKVVLKGIECWPHPEKRLGQQPARQRIQKRHEDYENRSKELQSAWPSLALNLTEAQRFQNEFLALVPS